MRQKFKFRNTFLIIFSMILALNMVTPLSIFADSNTSLLVINKAGGSFTGNVFSGGPALYPGGPSLDGTLTVKNEYGSKLDIDKLGMGISLYKDNRLIDNTSQVSKDFLKLMMIKVRYRNSFTNLFEGPIYQGSFSGFVDGADCSLRINNNRSADILFTVSMNEQAEASIAGVTADASFWVRLTDANINDNESNNEDDGEIINPGSNSVGTLLEEPNAPIPGAVGTKTIEDCVKKLKEEGILIGYDNGQLMLDKPITRTEAAALLARALKLEDNDKAYLTYKDKKAIPEWGVKYVVPLTKKSIFKGTDKKRFEPNMLITREQMAAILARAFEIKSDETYELLFQDNMQVSDWSKQYVKAAIRKGLMTEYESNKFKPAEKVTRGEMVVMLCKLLGYHEKHLN